MADAERDLLACRLRRQSARAVMQARIDRVRGAVSQRGIPARLGDEAFARVRSAAGQATSIMSEYRWLGAITVLALAGWFLRRPLLRWGNAAVNRIREGEPQSIWQRWRKWTAGKVKS